VVIKEGTRHGNWARRGGKAELAAKNELAGKNQRTGKGVVFSCFSLSPYAKFLGSKSLFLEKDIF
jgi:hypothetical protein